MGKNASVATKGGPRPAKPDFDGLVVVCTKCRKRQGLSRRAIGRSLKRAFRALFDEVDAGSSSKSAAKQNLGIVPDRNAIGHHSKRDRLARKLKVVETGCLGPCPKRMLTLATPAALSRGQVQLLDPALPAEAVGELLGEAAPKRVPRGVGPDAGTDGRCR